MCVSLKKKSIDFLEVGEGGFSKYQAVAYISYQVIKAE